MGGNPRAVRANNTTSKARSANPPQRRPESKTSQTSVKSSATTGTYNESAVKDEDLNSDGEVEEPDIR